MTHFGSVIHAQINRVARVSFIYLFPSIAKGFYFHFFVCQKYEIHSYWFLFPLFKMNQLCARVVGDFIMPHEKLQHEQWLKEKLWARFDWYAAQRQQRIAPNIELSDECTGVKWSHWLETKKDDMACHYINSCLLNIVQDRREQGNCWEIQQQQGDQWRCLLCDTENVNQRAFCVRPCGHSVLCRICAQVLPKCLECGVLVSEVQLDVVGK